MIRLSDLRCRNGITSAQGLLDVQRSPLPSRPAPPPA